MSVVEKKQPQILRIAQIFYFLISEIRVIRG